MDIQQFLLNRDNDFIALAQAILDKVVIIEEKVNKLTEKTEGEADV
ncbi:MAG: hypothetical protein WAP07_01230 [Acutalibacteraceae bacterium]